jgi:exopolyphosphatase/guanosine-5'-triphosphate,3'-diphosphate pyrophosphatase
VLEDNRHDLHIDVGGGSTEFNIYHDRRKVAAQSFEIGSIRRMQQEQSGRTVEEMNGLWQRMEAWVRENARRYHVTRAIGTGGNINKLYSMSPAAPNRPITRRSVQALLDRLSGLSMNERVNVEWASVNSMIVPDIGLKDGMLQALFEQYFDEISPTVHPSIMPVADVENGPIM